VVRRPAPAAVSGWGGVSWRDISRQSLVNHSQTKLAVRTVVVGYRSARDTARLVGGSRGNEIAAQAKARAKQILDEIDDHGTDAENETEAARREVEGLSDE
jgi:hypothetical protein